jgi:hypothetical protein
VVENVRANADSLNAILEIKVWRFNQIPFGRVRLILQFVPPGWQKIADEYLKLG